MTSSIPTSAPSRLDPKVLGDAEAGPPGAVLLSTPAARHHLHLLGATGVGKSTLLIRLVLQDVRAGRGVVVLDPKGDLVDDLTDRLPLRRADGSPVAPVALIDPAHRKLTPTLNPLAADDPELAVDQLVGIFRRIFEAYWGPRTDDVLRAACLTLAHRGGGLADVPDLLDRPGHPDRLLAGVADAAVLRGFWTWYADLSDAERARVTAPLQNKLRAFLMRGFVRRIIAAPTTSLDVAGVLDGGVLLARLPKGLLGEETCRLLGGLLLAQVWQAATARAAQADRRDAGVYLDECHNFLTLPNGVDDMLAEARGYHLSLTLAHQHLGQLPRPTRDALAANARNKIYFQVSPDDARALERHVAPVLKAHDLAHLAAYQAACRLVSDGLDAPACTLRTRPSPAAVHGRRSRLHAAARTAAPPDRDRDEWRRQISPLPP